MRHILFVLVMTLFVGIAGEAYTGDVAVIVNKENGLSEVSFRDLVKIFRQEKQYWEGGKKIYLTLLEAGSPEKTIVLKKIYRMDEEELKKFWLGKLYTQEVASFPKTLGSGEAVKRFVGQVPNALGVIDASSADDRVKVLRIDGKLPGEGGYALGENSP